MAVVQARDTYNEQYEVGEAGHIDNTQTYDVDSRMLQGNTNLAFGRAVGQGANWDQVVPTVSVDTVTGLVDFRGISVKDKTLRPVQEDEYVAGDTVSVLIHGSIWVPVSAAITTGSRVAVDENGRFKGDYGFVNIPGVATVFGNSETADAAAARSIRDAYFTGDNQATLARFNQDRFMCILLVWDDGTAMERRNAGGTAWVAETTKQFAIRGARFQRGVAANKNALVRISPVSVAY